MLGPVLLRRRCPAVPRFDGPALLRDGSLNDHAEHVNILPTMDVVCWQTPMMMYRMWQICVAVGHGVLRGGNGYMAGCLAFSMRAG